MSETLSQPRLFAVVPVKPLHESKTRLAHLLSPAQRAELIHGFLQRTLSTLTQVRSIERVLVISSDPVVLATAREYGALDVDEGGVRGLNRAVARAVDMVTQLGASTALIIPADLPFLRRTDVELMIPERYNLSGRVVTEGSAISICSDDNRQGTNALSVDLPTGFAFQYGVDSFQRHLRETTRLGITARIVHSPGLAFDLDSEEDWSRYQEEAKDQPPSLHSSQSVISM